MTSVCNEGLYHCGITTLTSRKQNNSGILKVLLCLCAVHRHTLGWLVMAKQDG